VTEANQAKQLAKGTFTPEPAWHGTYVPAMQCNTYEKFQCESGNGGAVPCRAAQRAPDTDHPV